MEIYLEQNQRLGHGFQVRITHGPMDKTYDNEPLDMYTAGAYAGTLLEMVNKEMIFSGRGTVLILYFSWLDDRMPKAREAIKRYCQYIATHGYKGGASKALEELDRLDQDGAVEWIRRTYARHVRDDRALIAYVMGQ